MDELDSAETTVPDAERRSADRRKWLVEVAFEGGDATGIAQTADISLGGLYLATDAVLSHGTGLFLKLQIGGSQIGIPATVAFVEEGKGVGVRFDSLTEDAEEVLRSKLGLE